MLLVLCATVAILTTIGIVFSVLFETYRFFYDPALKGRPTIPQFLFGTEWNPQEALRADQGDIKTAFGFIPLLTGTLLITFIAICVAGPLGLFSAIYLSEYATPRVRAVAKPVLEILAGIPTVVLGFFAALTVAPLIRGWGEYFGLNVASESALAAGLVMGMMIIPFISSLSDDVINAVPQSLRDGAYALGATKSETIKQVVLPAALPGIVSAFMLAISRAIGETMIVVMAAGLAANLTFNPLEAVTTITVQIKTILVGDQEFDSAKTLAAFALGFVLFFVTLHAQHHRASQSCAGTGSNMTDIAASSPLDARPSSGPDLGQGAGARAQTLSGRGAVPRLRPHRAGVAGRLPCRADRRHREKGPAGVHPALVAARCRRARRPRRAGKAERPRRHTQRRLFSRDARCAQGRHPRYREPLRREDADAPAEHGRRRSIWRT